MALENTKVKEELAALREKKASIERKIKGLEQYLGIQGSLEKTNGGSISARGGVDIRPDVRALFETNGNELMRLKDIVEKVGEKHPEMERIVIERKMIHVKRTILEQQGYGMYRLKPEEGTTDQ